MEISPLGSNDSMYSAPLAETDTTKQVVTVPGITGKKTTVEDVFVVDIQVIDGYTVLIYSPDGTVVHADAMIVPPGTQLPQIGSTIDLKYGKAVIDGSSVDILFQYKTI